MGLAKEPTLVLRLSHPQAFQCSACPDPHRGAFDAEGWAVDVVEAFRNHVKRYPAKEVAQDKGMPVKRSSAPKPKAFHERAKRRRI
jgi:hypothetical protein